MTHHPSLLFLDLGFTRATPAVGELGNQMRNAGATSLATMLRENRVLRALDITHNGVSQAGLDTLRDALATNMSLTTLECRQFGKATNSDSLDVIRAALAR